MCPRDKEKQNKWENRVSLVHHDISDGGTWCSANTLCLQPQRSGVRLCDLACSENVGSCLPA